MNHNLNESTTYGQFVDRFSCFVTDQVNVTYRKFEIIGDTEYPELLLEYLESLGFNVISQEYDHIDKKVWLTSISRDVNFSMRDVGGIINGFDNYVLRKMLESI